MACGAAGYTLEDLQQAEEVRRAALNHPGPAIVQAVVDPHEPPMPGKITTDQAFEFAKALSRGQREAWEIIKTVAENKVREVI
jgi:pyruvate dehydrogenase (quinone)